MPGRNPVVESFVKALDHPLKTQIANLRLLVLNGNHEITEEIKWNAPTFNDRATFNLRSTKQVQMVLHRGVKVKDSTDFVFEDETGFLTWPAKDRALMTVPTEGDLEAAAQLVVHWIKATRD